MNTFKQRRYVPSKKTSHTLDAILANIYQKHSLKSHCGRYADSVMSGIVSLGLVKKVVSKKGTYYFKTEKSKNFKAIDFAKEFLWFFHNSSLRVKKNGERFIYCYDEEIDNGSGLVDLEKAIKRGYV